MASSLQLCCVRILIWLSLFLHATQAATEYNRYLAHIFQKYGNGGTMSFEGLEHLMYSLGLGHIEFEPEHTIEEHRPKGYKVTSENEASDHLRSYFEEQTKKLKKEDSDDDVDLALPPQDGKAVVQHVVALAPTSRASVGPTADENGQAGVTNEFREMHDPKHRHPRENDATFDGPPLSSNVCLSPKSLLRLVVDHDDLHKRKLYKTITMRQEDAHDLESEYNEFVNNVRLTPVAFMKLCPALLAQIDQHVCIQPAPIIHSEAEKKEMIWNAWIYATGSIFILSACGLLGILLVPLMKSVAYQEILKFLVAVAVGTLSGDALMHLLPHALQSQHAAHDDEPKSIDNDESSHGHDLTAVYVCGCAFATAVFMYILENLLPLLKGDSEAAHGHSHVGGHGHSHGTVKATTQQQQHGVTIQPTDVTANNAVADVKDVREMNVMLHETKLDEKSPNRPLTPVAFMVVIGDGLHNLTDGLAIGAAFASDPVTGMATAFAVLCHELPHELGDFALLLQTGVSIRRAVYLNIVSSVLSFVGMAVGLLIAGVHSNMTQWIYAGTAGSFLYIAFADLIPTMGVTSEDGMKRDFTSVIVQIVGIIVGGLIMLLIAVNEDALEKLFK